MRKYLIILFFALLAATAANAQKGAVIRPFMDYPYVPTQVLATAEHMLLVAPKRDLKRNLKTYCHELDSMYMAGDSLPLVFQTVTLNKVQNKVYITPKNCTEYLLKNCEMRMVYPSNETYFIARIQGNRLQIGMLRYARKYKVNMVFLKNSNIPVGKGVCDQPAVFFTPDDVKNAENAYAAQATTGTATTSPVSATISACPEGGKGSIENQNQTLRKKIDKIETFLGNILINEDSLWGSDVNDAYVLNQILCDRLYLLKSLTFKDTRKVLIYYDTTVVYRKDTTYFTTSESLLRKIKDDTLRNHRVFDAEGKLLWEKKNYGPRNELWWFPAGTSTPKIVAEILQKQPALDIPITNDDGSALEVGGILNNYRRSWASDKIIIKSDSSLENGLTSHGYLLYESELKKGLGFSFKARFGDIDPVSFERERRNKSAKYNSSIGVSCGLRFKYLKLRAGAMFVVTPHWGTTICPYLDGEGSFTTKKITTNYQFFFLAPNFGDQKDLSFFRISAQALIKLKKNFLIGGCAELHKSFDRHPVTDQYLKLGTDVGAELRLQTKKITVFSRVTFDPTQNMLGGQQKNPLVFFSYSNFEFLARLGIEVSL